jgi:hypothetical protein
VKPDKFWEKYPQEDYHKYFPLESLVKSNMFKRLSYPTNGFVEITETGLGLDSIEINDDSLFQLNPF